jgi:D-lyxose ketol-isomerase
VQVTPLSTHWEPRKNIKNKKKGTIFFVHPVYAPTEDKGEDIKEQFYEELQRTQDRVPNIT